MDLGSERLEVQNLTDEEIYHDVLRPGSQLSAFSDESPIKPTFPTSHPNKEDESLGRTPNHLSTSRFSASPYPSRYLQDTAMKPSDFTFTRPSNANVLEQLASDLTVYIQEANIALEKCSEAKHRLSEERESVLHLAQQLVTEEAREVSMRLDRHRDMLQALLTELRSQNVNAVRLSNNRETSESVLALARQKAEKVIQQLRQEISRRPLAALGTEVISKQSGEDLRLKMASGEQEIDRLRTACLDLERKLASEKPQNSSDVKALEQTIDSLRKDNSFLSSEKQKLTDENLSLKQPIPQGQKPTENWEKIDSMIALKIEELVQRVNEYSRGYTEAWKTLKDSLNRPTFAQREEADFSHFQSFASLARLKDVLDTAMSQMDAKLKVKDELSERVLVSYKQSALSDLRSLHMKSEEQVQQLRDQIQSEERQAVKVEVSQLRESNQKLSDILATQTHQMTEIREKYDSLSNELRELRAERVKLMERKETEMKEMKTGQEQELERRLRMLKLETEEEVRRARERLDADLQARYSGEFLEFQTRNSNLEQELTQLKQDLALITSERDRLEELKETLALNLESDCARKLEQMRRVYTDKYDELYRITTAQINELEMKLQSAEHAKLMMADTVKNKVIQKEESVRMRQLEKLQMIHKREIAVITREIEEFTSRAKHEISRLSQSLEDALKHPGEHALLRGLRSDLASLSNHMEFRIKKPTESLSLVTESKEEDSVQCALISGSQVDMRICKRCGGNDKSDTVCRFHPYLVKSGAADYLYGPEWHKCREDHHSIDHPACYSVQGHFYGPATVWSPNNAGNSLAEISDILSPDSAGYTFAPGRRSQGELQDSGEGGRMESRKVLDLYDGPEKEKIISAVKDLKQRSSRKASPSSSLGQLQATAAFSLPVQKTPVRSQLDSALFESEKQVRFEARRSSTPVNDRQTLRIPGAKTVMQKRGDSWNTAGAAVDEEKDISPSEQLAKYLSRRCTKRFRPDFPAREIENSVILMASEFMRLRAEFRGLTDPVDRYAELLPFAFSGFAPGQRYQTTPNLASISEIVITPDLILALDSSGKCCTYLRETSVFHLTLNTPLQSIRTLYFNRPQSSLVVVFIQDDERFSRLHCDSFLYSDLVLGLLRPVHLFEEEDLTHPGFIEFDEANLRIVTRSGSDGVFRLWKMTDYSLCYRIDQPGAEEIRLTDSLVLIILYPQNGKLPLKLLNVENGHLLNAYVLDILPDRTIELVEQFREFLLFKQTAGSLHILNLLSLSHVRVSGFNTPQAFLFLPEQMLFIAITGGVLETWNFLGERVSHIEAGTQLLTSMPLLHPTKIAMCANQQVVLLASKKVRVPLSQLSVNGPNVTFDKRQPEMQFYDVKSGRLVDEAISEELLPSISTLHYDEETHEVFTGHVSGMVYRWSN